MTPAKNSNLSSDLFKFRLPKIEFRMCPHNEENLGAPRKALCEFLK